MSRHGGALVRMNSCYVASSSGWVSACAPDRAVSGTRSPAPTCSVRKPAEYQLSDRLRGACIRIHAGRARVSDDVGDQAVYQCASEHLVEFRLAGEVPEHLVARPLP